MREAILATEDTHFFWHNGVDYFSVPRVLGKIRVGALVKREETERVDHAIHTTMDRIDDTADRVRSNVRAKTSAVVGFVRGLRVAMEWMLHSRHQAHDT